MEKFHKVDDTVPFKQKRQYSLNPLVNTLNLKPRPHESETFETARFVTRVRVDRALKPFGKRFQNYAVGVSGFPSEGGGEYLG